MPNTQPNSPGNVRNASLVRKPGFRDFVNPDDYKPTTPPLPPTPPVPVPDARTSELSKSITERPYTWIS